jgi:hypothetical protein
MFGTENNLKWKKIVNYKILDLVGYYKFDVNFVSIRHC